VVAGLGPGMDPCFGRHGRLDRPCRRPACSERGAVRGPVPYRGLGDRSTRHRTTPSLEPSLWSSSPRQHWPSGTDRRGRTVGDSRQIARSRYALWKNPDDLNGRQRQQLDWIAKTAAGCQMSATKRTRGGLAGCDAIGGLPRESSEGISETRPESCRYRGA